MKTYDDWKEEAPTDDEVVECEMCGVKTFKRYKEHGPYFCSLKCEKAWFED